MVEERKTIYLCLAHMSEERVEQKYVKEAFDTNWVVPMGPNVNAFEQELSDFANTNSDGSKLNHKVVCLSSGTAAVHLALIACGVKSGDEVCVQSFTFCASSHPITYLGAKPVFIDSERETWNMDPELLEKAILDRKEKTGTYPKAIIPVALYGMPYDCEKIMAIADKYDIPVIEDAAEGMGSRFNGQVLGTFGRFGVLSFNGNKMITTSGGGALICQNDEDANNVMWHATQARDAYPYYQHTEIGYNYWMHISLITSMFRHFMRNCWRMFLKCIFTNSRRIPVMMRTSGSVLQLSILRSRFRGRRTPTRKLSG